MEFFLGNKTYPTFSESNKTETYDYYSELEEQYKKLIDTNMYYLEFLEDIDEISNENLGKNVSSIMNYDDYKIFLQKLRETINNINFLNNIKLSLYCVYDGFLGKQYGSDIYIYSTIENFLTDKMSICNININYYMINENIDFMLYVKSLYLFLTTNTCKTYIMDFGSSDHSTKIYIQKIVFKKKEYIKVVYINTGLGINNKYNTIGEYYDLFKTIYIKKEEYNEFINILLPYLYYKHSDIKIISFNPEIYKLHYYLCMYQRLYTGVPIPERLNLLDQSTKEYYNELSHYVVKTETIIFYNKLVDLFVDGEQIFDYYKHDSEYIDLIKHDKQNISKNHKKIIDYWNKYIIDISNDKYIYKNNYLQKYLIKSIENISLLYENNKIYCKPQKSGTCVYFSMLLSLMYYFGDNDPDNFINFYYNLAVQCHDFLSKNFQNIDFLRDILKDGINSPIILQKIIDDGFISDDYDYYKIIKKTTGCCVEVSDVDKLSYSKISFVPIEKLNKILEKIRHQPIDWSKIEKTYFKYINKKKCNYVQPLNEIYILYALWEFYNNSEFWEKKIYDSASTNTVLNLYGITGVRIKLLEDEELWLSVFISYISNNYEKKIFHKSFFRLNEELVNNPIPFGRLKIYRIFVVKSKFLSQLIYKFVDIIIFNNYNDDNIKDERYDEKQLINFNRYITETYESEKYGNSFICKYLIDNPVFVLNSVAKLQIYIKIFIYFYLLFDRITQEKIIKSLFDSYYNIMHIYPNTNFKPIDLIRTIGIITNTIFIDDISDVKNFSNMREDHFINFSIDGKPVITNYYNEEVINFEINISNFDNIMKIIKEECYSSKDKLNIDALKICNFTKIINMNFTKYLSYNDEGLFVYTDINKNSEKCSLVTKTNNFFINLLAKDNNTIFRTDNYILIVLKNNKYEYSSDFMKDNYILSFKIKDNIIDYDNIYINNNKVILSNDSKKYPFLMFTPETSINFININEITNDIVVYIVKNFYSSEIKKGPLYMSVHSDEDSPKSLLNLTNKHFFMKLEIKQNFLSPVLDEKKYKYLILIKDSTVYFNKKFINNISKTRKNRNYNINHNVVSFYKIQKLIKKTDSGITQLRVKENEEKTLVDFINERTLIINCGKNCNIYGNQHNYNCTSLCENLSNIISVITNIIKKIIKLRSFISSIMNFNCTDFVNFIVENYHNCFNLLQINTYITVLLRLVEIFKNCEVLSCHEILEINQLFDLRKRIIDIEDYKNKIPISDAIFEIIFGNIIKKEQWLKYFSILNNFKNSDINKKWEIHQFMMGKGKSSVITPMLMHNLSYEMNQNIYIVVPDHLVIQTQISMFEYGTLLNFKYEVITDGQLKYAFVVKQSNLQLYNKETSNIIINNKSIFIFDEIDYMYEPTQSNFNLIINKTIIDESFIKLIFSETMLYLEKKYEQPIRLENEQEELYKLYGFYEICEFKKIIKNIIDDKNNIKNINYGMSYIDENLRICIPYSDKRDSPVEKSRFSSNLITLVLTIKYFYNEKRNNFIFEKNDIIKLCNNNNNDFFDLLAQYIECEPFEVLSSTNIFHKLNEYYLKTNDSIEMTQQKLVLNRKMMYIYYILITTDVIIPTNIMNCSFIDIINMDVMWQIGYSGTVNIDLDVPTNTKLIKFNKNIIHDPDEQIEVYNAFTRNEEIIYVTDVDSFISYFISNNFDILIDACAFFKDYDNTLVAQLLNEKTNKPVIYLLKNDHKMIYDKYPMEYIYKNYKKGEVIFYYSQRHIVGVDFRQPTILNGVVLINNNNNYTQMSQAIYRMRKLNKGHSIIIGYCENTPNIKSTDIYKILVDNETRQTNNKKSSLYLQYLKYYVRNYITSDYNEEKIEPVYFLPHNNTDDEFMVKFTLDRLNKNLFKPDFGINIIDNCPQIQYASEKLEIIYINNILKLLYNDTRFQQFINILFNLGNSKDIAMDINKDKIISKSIDKKIELTKTRQEILKFIPELKNIARFFYNYKNNTIYDKHSCLSIINSKSNITIHFSNRLLDISFKEKFYFLKINNNILVEPFNTIKFYLCNVPIYNIYGELVNKFILSSPSDIYPDKINIDEIFAINITNEELTTNNIYLGDLINKQKYKEITNVTINSDDYSTLVVIISIFYKGGQIYINQQTKYIVNTLLDFGQNQILKKMFSDITVRNIDAIIDHSKSYDSYIKTVLLNDNKFICDVTGTDYNCIKIKFYFNYCIFNSYDRHYASRALEIIYNDNIPDSGHTDKAESKLSSDEGFKHKYLKYKNKYIQLKSKISPNTKVFYKN
jgi:hypothetical protein